MGEELAVGEVEHWREILHIVLREDVVLLGKRSFYSLWRCGDGGAGIGADNVHQRRMQNVVHGEENYIQRLLAVLLLNQVVDVRNTDLRREAGIDRASTGPGAIKFRTGVIGINNILWLH